MAAPAGSATTARYARLSRDAQKRLLAGIVARCKTQAARALQGHARTPVVVFDLDGTLMDNRPRTVAILREFATSLSEDHPHRAPAARLASVGPEDLAYLVRDSLARVGLTDDALVEAAETFWKERFFTDEGMKHDVALAGAVAFAHACHEAGAICIYLTGRDLPLMGIGSFRSLRDLGFPIGVPGTELVCKPDFAMPDEDFKRLEAPKLVRVGQVVASFDNEPGNCNVFLRHDPQMVSVLIDTQHLPGAPPLDPGVQVIADFRQD
jgi:hypothetical protein